MTPFSSPFHSRSKSTNSLKIFPATSEPDMKKNTENTDIVQKKEENSDSEGHDVPRPSNYSELRDHFAPLQKPLQLQPLSERKGSSGYSSRDSSLKSDNLDHSMPSDFTVRKREESQQSVGTKSYKSRSSFNFIERMSFSFMNDMIKDGASRDLLVSEYPPVEKVDESDHLGNALLNIWNTEKNRLGKKAKLWRTLWKLFGFNFILAGFPYLAESLIKIAQSYIFGMMLVWFTINGPLQEGLIYAGVLSVLVFCHSGLNQYKFYMTTRIGMQMRLALTSALFNKSLKLPISNSYSSGQITSFISSDVQKVEDASGFIHFLWVGPLETLLITYFVYTQIGLAAFAAVGALILLIPLQSIFANRFSSLRKIINVFRDERIKNITDMITGMLVIKAYAWEMPFIEKIEKVRKNEMNSIRKAASVKATNESIFFASSAIISIFAFTTFYLLGGTFSASIVFTTATYLQTVRMTMTNLFAKGFQFSSECMVSLQRMEKFFLLDDLPIYTFKSPPGPAVLETKDTRVNVVLNHASFSWKHDQMDPKIKEDDDLVLRDISLQIRKGELVGVCGPVGSGKSSLISAVLGEMKCVKGTYGVRSRNIGFVSQNPFIVSGSFKDNILFGRPYREEWFNEVVKACCLDMDFSNFPEKELTFIEERGKNLSGGQKARLSLARAVYGDSDIYLLDDPLSAVDPKVGKHLFKYCICGVLKKKTILLVTHLLHYVQQCDQVLLLEHGKIRSSGSFANIASITGSRFALNASQYISKDQGMHHENSFELTDSQEFRLSLAKRLSIKEEKETRKTFDSPNAMGETLIQGSISFKSYQDYFKAGAGLFFLSFLVALMVLGQASLVMTDWWLANWSRMNAVEQRDLFNLLIFIGLAFFTFLVSICRAMMFFSTCLTSSSNLFTRMTRSVFQAPIYFFQQNPHGRIMNRFTKDSTLTDETLPQTFFDFLQRAFMILGTIGIAGVVIPYVLIFLPFLIIIFMYFRKSYVQSARQMKRMDAITRSPVFTNFSVAVDGKATIRAYGVQEVFKHQMCRVLNDNTRIYFSFTNTGRWLGLRLDLLSAVFFMVVVFGVIPGKIYLNLTPSSAGLLISYVLQLVGLLQWTVRQSGEVENLMVSTERIMDYATNLPQETQRGLGADKLGPDWPHEGVIELKDLCMKYPGSEGLILKHITRNIVPGSKIGIVGRTGAGKSSFINALFRLTEPTTPGAVVIDGIKTSDIQLRELRSKMAIIPQEPFCFKGTIRFNLDPLSRHTDDELWDAISMVDLKESIAEIPGGLDGEVCENGANFSVGEKQLICLARAILRSTKILVMDEATANIDVTTDKLIQDVVGASGKGYFSKSTVITIAHRLHTIIDYDIIFVLDRGVLVESGPPNELILKNPDHPDSWFARMVSELGNEAKGQLIELSKRKRI